MFSKKTRLSVLVVLVLSLVLTSSVLAYDLTELGLEPSYDLGGNTVTLISWTAERIENYLRTDPITMGRIEEAEELFNCKIEFMQSRDIPGINFNRLLAGESTYDLWFTQSRIGYYQIVGNGAANPMGDILPSAYYDSLAQYEKDSIELLGFYGKTYGIGKTHFGSGQWNAGGIVMFYNKTLLEEQGVEDPYELYRDDEWTWDVAVDMLQSLTKDLDGDGVTDIYGTTAPYPYSFIISNGGSVTKEDETGHINFALDYPESIEALEAYADWYSRGIVGGDFMSRTAAFSHGFLNAGSNYFAMEDDWGVVPFPRGPQEEQYYYPEWSPETTVIPVNAKQPEGLAALHAFLFRADDVSLNEVIARTVQDQNSASILLELQTDWTPVAKYLYEGFGGSLVDQAMASIRGGQTSATVAVAEIKNQVQAELDDFQATKLFQ